MTIILDGKKISTEIINDLKVKLLNLGEKPSLVVILVGENSASKLYVKIKENTAKEIGINSEVIRFPQDIEENVLLDEIAKLNNSKNVDAILVQLPLPKHINSKNIIQAISPKKDVDGFTPENVGRISIGVEPYAYPCTPKGILRLLDEYKIDLTGKSVVIVGRSNIVGKPLAQMMLNRNATVTICHSQTKNLSDITKTADVLISAVGVNNIITDKMVKNNAIVVDVGICKVCDKTCGDVDFDKVSEVSSFITPVPGGIGPMTIAMLMSNTYELFKLNRNI